LDFTNYEDAGQPIIGLKRKRKFKKKGLLQSEKDLIDLDALHSCLSPPSPIRYQDLEPKKIKCII
jgi:hypothetical protein